MDIQKVIYLEPDLILAAPIHEKEVIPELRRRGLVVLTLSPETLEEVLQDIALIGEVNNTTERASQLVADMESMIEAVTKEELKGEGV